MGLLRRVLVALLTVTFVLAPFHTHNAAESDAGKAAIVLSDDGQQGTDIAPDSAVGECAVCMMLKQIEIAATFKHSIAVQITESVVYPAAEVQSSRRLIAEHFRPPCSACV
jgi:hypothetical protein